MDKDNIPAGAGLPPTGRFSPFSPSSSPAIQPQFSHDLSRMHDNPSRNSGHRRAHSEILTLPEDISFESDLGVVGGGGPSFSDETDEDLFSMFLDMDKVNSHSSATSGFEVGGDGGGSGETSEPPRGRHQHSQSMDGSSTIKPEMLEDGSGIEDKKAVSATQLAELALVDPKRAKRIWANRQSAARSKERKMRYIAELERKVQILQTEGTSLSAQLTLLHRDTNGLTAENSELKLRLQTMEQQVHLQDALNDALKEEIQRLQMLTGQVISNGGLPVNFPASYGANQPFYPNNPGMQTLLTAKQFQQLQIRSQKQQFQNQQHQQLQQQQQLHRHQDTRPSSMAMAIAPKKDNLSSDPKPS